MTITRIDLQPLGGIAGDMFAAAAFDAWPDLYQAFQSDINQLSVSGLSAKLETRLSKGLSAGHFTVVQPAEPKPPRTLSAVRDFLQATTLDTELLEVAMGIYSLLAQAEAKVHGKTIETIHFHEVSDWDSMVDIIAAAGVISRLQCSVWRLAPLPLGGGTITTAHGDIPLPAPATVQLLQGYEWIDDGQPGERVTPTGAAIIAWLKPASMHGSTTAAALSAVGAGCGARELADRANILRITAFESSAAEQVNTDIVCSLAFEIDDMTGEELAEALQKLRQNAAVIDVSSVSMQGKKGRHVVGVRLLVLPESKDDVIQQCFSLCSTLGVRHSLVSRSTLQRHTQTVDGVRVKLSMRPENEITVKAESDDLAVQKSLAGRRRLATLAEQTAITRGFDKNA